MLTINELSHKVHEHIVTKQYAEGLQFFKQNKSDVEPTEIANNEFLVADVLTALRGIKAFEAAYQFMSIYNLKITENSSLRILNSYGWLLYFNYKIAVGATTQSSQNELHAVAPTVNLLEKRIVEFLLIFKNATDTYSLNLVEYLFKLLMHTEKAKSAANWQTVEKICQIVNPQNLSTTCSNIKVEQKGQQKDMELSSAREEWYSMYSKALYENGNYTLCLEVCRNAKTAIDKMHFSNEVWFERRIVQCLIKTGNTDAAITIYLQIVARKKDWFILKELSACYVAINNYDKALHYARMAATAFGPINFKIELIELLGDILNNQNNKLLANKHYRLAKMIREAEKWQVNKNLIEKISTTTTNEPQPQSKDKIKAELIEFWNEDAKKQDFRPKTLNNDLKTAERINGKIIKLLAPKEAGIDGFVKSDSGSTAYFFVSSNAQLFEHLKIGLPVKYLLKSAPKGDKAVDITLL